MPHRGRDHWPYRLRAGRARKGSNRRLVHAIAASLRFTSSSERHEPDVGEVNYPYLFELIDRLGYRGWIGCEYRPRIAAPGGTSAGLGWFQPYRKTPL